MRPRTAELVAGAVTWALARWATLREAPKQPDLITAGQDWSLLPHTHTRARVSTRGIHIITPNSR